jgi:hypothetical protein
LSGQGRFRRVSAGRRIVVGAFLLLMMMLGAGLFTSDAAPPVPYSYDMTFSSDFMGFDNLAGQWDRSGSDQLSFDRRNVYWNYELWEVNATNGTGETCISCNLSAQNSCAAPCQNPPPGTNNSPLPNRHMGAESWLPGGQFITLNVENEVHNGGYCQEPWCGSYAALPGYGSYNNIWIIRTDGSQAWQLTDIPQDNGELAEIIPRVSPNGNTLIWTERITAGDPFATDWHFWGQWRINIAPLLWSGGSFGNGNPYLGTVTHYQPFLGFQETASFSPDSTRMYFTGETSSTYPIQTDIYSVDLATLSDLRQLTNNQSFNEHPYVTADGNQIVWMSGRDSSNDADWWIMNKDGTNQQRLSYINESWHPTEWTGSAKLNGAAVLSPDTTYPIRFKGVQFPGPADYRGLIKQGTISRRTGNNGDGLVGQYYDDLGQNYYDGNPRNLVLTRTDPYIGFWWHSRAGLPPNNSPAPGVVPSQYYSATWTGKVKPYNNDGGWYVFRCVHDTGCRVFVNGTKIIDTFWWGWPGVDDGWIYLADPTQKYTIQVDFFHNAGDGSQLTLAWQGPDFAMETIPKTQLFTH